MGESDIRCEYTEKKLFFGIQTTLYLTDILHYYLLNYKPLGHQQKRGHFYFLNWKKVLMYKRKENRLLWQD